METVASARVRRVMDPLEDIVKLLSRLGIVLLCALVALVGVVSPTWATGKPDRGTPSVDYVHECPTHPEPGRYTCFALRRTGLHPHVAGADVPPGYGPADLQSAYRLPSATAGAGQTVFVIDAYGYSHAESDLAAYRSQYGLPACTTNNGCFRKVNQNGLASPLPGYNDGWAVETALDLDMVSASCPRCHITLIEADDNGDNLFKAVNQATTLGAKFVSMSWGGPEYGNESSYDANYFSKTGVVYAASSGDGAFQAGVSYPSTSKNVVAVGGTALVADSSARGWSESTWSTSTDEGTGSGCSSDETKPAWQQLIPDDVCTYRAGNDVSAVADPDTGVAVYQTPDGLPGGWSVYGGTSASAPIIASVYALAGTPASTDHPASYPYANTASLNDVTVGDNGTCDASLLCTAAAGWDGPTGLGTPSGLAAFGIHIITVANPGPQVASLANPVSLLVAATETPVGPKLTFAATGLPPGLKIGASGLVIGSPTTLGSSTVTVTAMDSTGASGSTTFKWTVGNAGTFTAVDAYRLLDTRKGIGATQALVPAGNSVALQVLGRGGIPPSGVSSVVLNVTATAPTNPGYVTVYPDGVAKPTTSNLDYESGQTIPNLVLAPVGADGKVRLYTSAGAHLIADVSGYYLKGNPVVSGAFAPRNPVRLLDTRKAVGAPTAVVRSGGQVELQVLGRGAVPSSHVSAVVLNVTATGATESGYVTVFPNLTQRPVASNVDFPAGQSVPNLVVVPVGTDGKVALYVAGGGNTTNLIADVFGYYTDATNGTKVQASAAGTLGALPPSRVLDTRNGNGVGIPGPVGSGQTVKLKITDRGGVPAGGVSAVVLNVLVAHPTGAGYVTVYADGVPKPYTSNLDYAAGQTIANLVVVPVSTAGYVDLTVTGQGTTALIADVSGYYLSGG